MKVASFFVFASKCGGCKSNTISSNFNYGICSDQLKNSSLNLLKPQYRQFHASTCVQRRQEREDRGIINRDLIGNVEVKQGTETSVAGVNIPHDFYHYMTDPYGRKGKRDKIQEKKAKRLKNIHDRSREPKLVSSLHESMKTKPEFSRRQLQIGNQLKRALLDIMCTEFMQKPVNLVLKQAGFTIIDIEMSKDIKHSKILWKCEGSNLKEKVIAVVNHKATANYLRFLTAKKLPHLKFSPELSFVDTESIDSNTKEAADIIDSISKKFQAEEADMKEEELSPKVLTQRADKRSQIMSDVVKEYDQKHNSPNTKSEPIPRQKGIKTKGYSRFFQKERSETPADPKWETSKKNRKKLR